MQPAKLGIITAKYRKKNKLTVRQFAEKCGLSKAYISVLENGRPNSDTPPSPSLSAVLAIATAMEMDAGELLKRLGLTFEPVNPVASKSTESKIEPFAYIEPTIDNLNDAAREGRLLILPFKVPRLRDFVYVPMYAQDGMVVAHTVTSVAGGVYEAYSEYSGSIRFSLYDINRTVFVSRKLASDALTAWKAEHSDIMGRFVGPTGSMFANDAE